MNDKPEPGPDTLSDSRALDIIWGILASRQASNLVMPHELNVLISVLNENGRKIA